MPLNAVLLKDRDTRVYHTAGRSGGLRRYDPIGVLPLKSSLNERCQLTALCCELFIDRSLCPKNGIRRWDLGEGRDNRTVRLCRI